MNSSNPTFSLLAWLRLARISALPSAISNILLGYLLASRLQGATWSTIELLMLIGSSAMIYSAGMILNDVFDIETDRSERPNRPLPSGQIKLFTARWVGYILLLIGVGLAPLASALVSPDDWTNFSRRLSVVTILACLVIIYNGRLKTTPLSPIVMGGCRCANLLLGASAIGISQSTDSLWLGFAPGIWYLAGCLGVYVAGISWLARQEAEKNPKVPEILFGGLVMLAGVAGFALTYRLENLGLATNDQWVALFPFVVGLIGLPLLRRWIAAMATLRGEAIQMVVILALRTIIIFDAVLCLFIAPDLPGYALLVVGLLVPTWLLGKWLRPT